MKISNLYSAILLLPVLFLGSCYGNEIDLDVEKQFVERKNGNILDLHIKNEDGSSCFSIMGGKHCKTNRFYLKNMHKSNPDHIFLKADGDSLRPNTEYEVSSCSNGDAATCFIHITTDELGNASVVNRDAWAWDD